MTRYPYLDCSSLVQRKEVCRALYALGYRRSGGEDFALDYRNLERRPEWDRFLGITVTPNRNIYIFESYEAASNSHSIIRMNSLAHMIEYIRRHLPQT